MARPRPTASLKACRRRAPGTRCLRETFQLGSSCDGTFRCHVMKIIVHLGYFRPFVYGLARDPLPARAKPDAFHRFCSQFCCHFTSVIDRYRSIQSCRGVTIPACAISCSLLLNTSLIHGHRNPVPLSSLVGHSPISVRFAARRTGFSDPRG